MVDNSRCAPCLRFFVCVMLIINVDYMLSNFQVPEVKDFASLVAIILLFRCFALSHAQWSLYVFTAALSFHTFWDITIVYHWFTGLLDALSLKLVQFIFTFGFFFCGRLPYKSLALIGVLLFMKLLEVCDLDMKYLEKQRTYYEIYQKHVVNYFEEAEALIVLALTLFIGHHGVFALLRGDDQPQMRNSGVLGFLQHKLRVTNSFKYFAFYFIISIFWNLILNKSIVNSLVQVFGMACMVWFITSNLLSIHEAHIPALYVDKFRSKILKLDFFVWFLAIIFYYRAWRIDDFEEKMVPLLKPLIVIEIYALASYRNVIRVFHSVNTFGLDKRAKCVRNNSMYVHYVIVVFAALNLVGCWLVGVDSVVASLVIVLSCKLGLSVLEDWLSFNKRWAKAVVCFGVNTFVISILIYYIGLGIKNDGVIACFQVVNLLWMNQLYVSGRRIWEKCTKLSQPYTIETNLSMQDFV